MFKREKVFILISISKELKRFELLNNNNIRKNKNNHNNIIFKFEKWQREIYIWLDAKSLFQNFQKNIQQVHEMKSFVIQE